MDTGLLLKLRACWWFSSAGPATKRSSVCGFANNAPTTDLCGISKNLQSDLSTLALAARVAMSERNFQRVFTREIGKPPPLYVEELRLEAVRRKLEGTHRGLEEIASACGFNSADVMSRSFQRHFKTTTADYRACFRTSGAQPLSKRRKEPKPG